MDDREYKSIIEALLYVWAEPIHLDELAAIIDLNKVTTKRLLSEMQDEIEHYRRGLVLNEYDDYYQFSTRLEHSSYISKLVKDSKKRELSNSSMETLAIIAYKQPVTRIEVDNIRGVKSSSSIDTLVKRGLITEVGRLDKIGKPILYGTTLEFLRFFNIQSLDQLPEIKDLEKLDEHLLDGDYED